VRRVSDDYYDALNGWSDSWRLLVAGVAAWRLQVPGESPTDVELRELRRREAEAWERIAALQDPGPLRG
jgi:hypothetical protein